MPSSDPLAPLQRLDGLAQVVYAGFERFVVISRADALAWSVYVALKGGSSSASAGGGAGAGRWWRGAWSAREVRGAVGKDAGAHEIEALGSRLETAFVVGDIEIEGWTGVGGEKLTFVLAETTRVSLTEMQPGDAAALATELLSQLALSARNRGCRLDPSEASYAPRSSSTAAPAVGERLRAADSGVSTSASGTKDGSPVRNVEAAIKTSDKTSPKSRKTHKDHDSVKHEESDGGSKAKTKMKTKEKNKSKSSKSKPNDTSGTGTDGATDSEAQRKIKELEAELARARKKARTPPPGGSEQAVLSAKPTGASARPPKGASLANPNKKARKYQALEFESDDE
ncbi:hypothetical protein CONPUDRAFT_163742 [Coniophora puteana RWD-64-598 SS2]|uniref:Uncharacterized protein n=1 Tax=Coniophora puteana (strain RWD-64-598) TaxID=741705 RepID=A0A5M3MTZ3_CONPW|nr:uncharacterized protein CONPUDRAFT_163742 [Coniophora puteana RWD-64-598 SS2]EIW82628.1 hypothetical protein CONPUDRAFT_163742 [Coniophora puteana RWD-64-598 SS2]